MEQARRTVRDLVDVDARARADAPASLGADLDKVLRLATPARGEARREGAAGGRDWGPALELVRQAAAVVRESQAHVSRMEVQTREMVQRARDELKSAEARTQAAEARAQAAEARAKESEEWLRRLTEALHEEFGPGSAASGDLA